MDDLDEDLKQLYFRTEYLNQNPYEFLDKVKPSSKAVVPTDPATNVEPMASSETKLPTMSKTLVRNVAVKGDLCNTEQYQDLNVSTETGNKMKKYCLLNGWLEENVYLSGGRGGRYHVLKATNKGCEYADVEKVIHGKGKAEHRFWQHRVSRRFIRKGYKTHIEYYVGNKLVDIVAEKGNERIAIELEISKPLTGGIENAIKDIRQGFKTVLVVVKKKTDQEKLTQKLGALGLADKCKVVLLRDII